ncbi:MAG: T9SS type A sorting domain-containing protein [Ignavibacteria bacterium]
MKKMSIIITLIIIYAQLISVIYVPENYPTIQQAINAATALNYDISVTGGPYNESIDFGSKKIYLHKRYSNNIIINGVSGSPVIDTGTATNSVLRGFNINSAYSQIGVFVESLNFIEISDCNFISLDIGIYIKDSSSPSNDYSTISDCYFYDNTYGCYLDDNSSWYNYTLKSTLTRCEFEDNTTAIYIDGCYYLRTRLCLFYENDTCYDMSNNRYCHCYLDRITAIDNSSGFDFEQYATFDIESSIIYDNTTNMTGTPSELNIIYSCVEGGYTGSGNIDDDPNLCYEYPYEYWLMEGSPCIDTGNPFYNDIDGTRRDMGRYPSLKDIKECEGDEYYNYVSFPRMNRTGNNTSDVTYILEGFLDWPFSDLYLYDRSGIVLEYDEDWSPTSYDVASTDGFKLSTTETGMLYLPSEYNGSRLDPLTKINLSDGVENWIGYWLPYTQNIEDAFGPFWEYIYSVEAEDWYYEWAEGETPTSSPTGKNMIYGKAYIVEVFEYVEDFYWSHITMSLDSSNEKSQNFTFTYLPNYEAIDVMKIPENVIEIGVYQDETCVGAVVVDEEDEQILAYTSGQSPLSFEVVTGSRQANQQVDDYSVYNKETGCYENRSLISGRQKHSVVMFGNIEEDTTHNSPLTTQLSNFPNPFNPETNISFSLPVDQEIELSIYNLKGQLVRQLISGQFTSGDHSINWDGADNEGKNVSSGLYLYKLKTGDHEYSKKMLLLK